MSALRRFFTHPIWHYSVRMILRMVEDHWHDCGSPWSVVSSQSSSALKCGHDGYWKTVYGNCMACRAEKVERSNAVLQNLVERKMAYANQLRMDLNAVRGEMVKCKALLGYDEGDLLDNVTRYFLYAEGEIALRDTKARDAIVYFERLTKIETAARELETFLWQNTGETADWPISITVRGGVTDDKASADEVTRLLQLHEVLK